MKKIIGLTFILFLSMYASDAWSCGYSYYVPDKPCSINATMGDLNDSWQITWEASNSYVHHYELYESALNGAWGLVYSGKPLSKWFYNKKQQGGYKYKVRACNSWGWCSAYSPISNVSSKYLEPSTVTVPPESTGDYTVNWVRTTSNYIGRWYLQERHNGPFSSQWKNVQDAYYATSKQYVDKPRTDTYNGSYSYRLRRCWNYYSYVGCQTQLSKRTEILPSIIGSKGSQPDGEGYKSVNISWSQGSDNIIYYYVSRVFQPCAVVSAPREPIRTSCKSVAGIVIYRGLNLKFTDYIPSYTDESIYRYTVYACTAQSCQSINQSSTNVIINSNAVVDSVPQSDYRYEVRYGDINYDGRLDFYVRRFNGDFTNGVIRETILQKSSNGEYIAINAFQSQFNTARLWKALPSNHLRIKDYNADGHIDIALVNIRDIIVDFEISNLPSLPGEIQIEHLIDELREATPQGLILFSSGQAGSDFVSISPQTITEIDDDLNKFFRDIYQWIKNPNYFTENAYKTIQEQVTEHRTVYETILEPINICLNGGCYLTFNQGSLLGFGPRYAWEGYDPMRGFNIQISQCNVPFGTRSGSYVVYGCYLVSDTYCPIINDISTDNINDFATQISQLNPISIYRNYGSN